MPNILYLEITKQHTFNYKWCHLIEKETDISIIQSSFVIKICQSCTLARVELFTGQKHEICHYKMAQLHTYHSHTHLHIGIQP